MAEVHLECFYCGHNWSETIYLSATSHVCPKCHETKMIKERKKSGANGDIFGYHLPERSSKDPSGSGNGDGQSGAPQTLW